MFVHLHLTINWLTNTAAPWGRTTLPLSLRDYSYRWVVLRAEGTNVLTTQNCCWNHKTISLFWKNCCWFCYWSPFYFCCLHYPVYCCATTSINKINTTTQLFSAAMLKPTFASWYVKRRRFLLQHLYMFQTTKKGRESERRTYQDRHQWQHFHTRTNIPWHYSLQLFLPLFETNLIDR